MAEKVERVMFCALFRHTALAGYIPGRLPHNKPIPDPYKERAVHKHERVHRGLVESTTTGIAALICGVQWAYHDVTALPGADALRQAFNTPYLKHYELKARTVHEGIATASEALFWAHITGQDTSGILVERPADYAVPARRFLNFCEHFNCLLDGLELEVRHLIKDSLILSLGIALLSPPVSENFYSAAASGNEQNYQHVLMALRQRERAINLLAPEKIISEVSILINNLREAIDRELFNPVAALEIVLPGEAFNEFRQRVLQNVNDPLVRPQLAVYLSRTHLIKFRKDIATTFCNAAGIGLGSIEGIDLSAFGLSISPDNPGTFGPRDVQRPVQCQREEGELWQLAALLEADSILFIPDLVGHLMIPEILGPFINDESMILIHVFQPDGQHKVTFYASAASADLSYIHRIFKAALEELTRITDITGVRCFGIVAPWSIHTLSISNAVLGLQLVEIPHFEVPNELVEYETLIGVVDGHALVRQSLTNGKFAWHVIRAPLPELNELRHILDRCYLWVLANGGNAHVIWQHNSREG